MRILLPTIRDPDQIGGGGTHLNMLVRGLRELGHAAEALYLTADMPGPVSRAGLVWPAAALNRLRTGWGMVYSADMRGRLLANATARELDRAAAGDAWSAVTGVGEGDLSSGPWEVLNAQEVYSIPYLRSVADERGIPLVLTLHGYPLYESVSEGYSAKSRMGLHYLMRTEMRALRLADAVVTVDTRLRDHVLSLAPEQAGSLHTLMNFIDTSVFTPGDDPEEEARLRRELRAAWEVPEGRIVLLCPRRLVKKNGVVYPSLALATMEETDRAGFLLLHAGEGGEREEIEHIVAENRLEQSVRLLGGQRPEAMRELYGLSDIVLVPSVHSEKVEEATSLSALEAMASGRPLIAGNVGGLAEIVVDGETGLLVPADAEALAAAILRLAAAPVLGSRLAAAAREYVLQHHSHVRAAAAYAEIYARVLGRESPAHAVSAHPPAARWRSLSVLGFTLDLVTLEQAAEWVIAAATEGVPAAGQGAIRAEDPADGESSVARRTRIAVSFNPELIVRAQRDPAAADAVLGADLCYPDGIGAVWAAARQGARVGIVEEGVEVGQRPAIRPAPQALERVPGIDLAQRVLELAGDRGLPVFFLGAAEGVAAEAARRQVELLPGLRIAGTHHGYFSPDEEGEVARTVRASGAAILLVAMGAPRQEVFLHRNRDRLGVAVALGVGGSFDVWAGTVRRAPSWSRRAKIEWLYRLATDPRRAGRQLALPRYAVQVVRWSPDDYGPPRRGRARGARQARDEGS